MNWSTPRLIAALLVSTFIFGSFGSTRVDASISRIAGPTPLFNEGRQFVKFDVAYDEANHVYLVVWGSQAAGPTNGMFLNQSGAPISGAFAISQGPQQAGWARVAYSSQLGKFLVTYTKILGGGAHQKLARFVQYAGGSPSMPPEIPIDSWTGNAASESGLVYSPAAGKFIVTWWVWQPNPLPVSWVALVDAGTNSVSGAVLVSEPSDGESDPEIACDPGSNRCLVVGYSWGIINGGLNTVWGRFVDATTGAAIGSVFVVHSSALEGDPTVAFSASSGKFVVGFVRDFKSVWSMTVSPAGALGAAQVVSPTPDPGVDGDGFGTINIVNNPGTGSFLMGMLSWTGLSVAQELDPNGARSGAFDRAPTDSGDWNQRGKYVVPAADAGARQFLVADNQRFQLARSTLYSTTGSIAPPPPPPGPTPVKITSFSANTALPPAQGTAVTWTVTGTGGTNLQCQFWVYQEGSGWSLGQDYGPNNTFTWTPLTGTNAVQVFVRSAGSPAVYEAYAGSGYFTVAGTARITSFGVDKSFPLPVYVPVLFTATATGGSAAVQYQFWRYSESTGWMLAQDYSSTNTFRWYPYEGRNAVQVWVRRVGSSAAYEDYAGSGMFTVTAAAKITGLSSNGTFPSGPGVPITWTTTGTSGGGQIECKYWLYSSSTGTWTVLRDWSVNNQVTWTPGFADVGTHAVQVWIRDVGSDLAYEDWTGTGYFAITTSGSLTLTPNRSLVGLRYGDTVTWTAQATGGTGNWQYAFWGYDNGSWVQLRPYTLNANTFSWTLSAGQKAVQVWILAPGTAGIWERWTSSGMFVVSP